MARPSLAVGSIEITGRDVGLAESGLQPWERHAQGNRPERASELALITTYRQVVISDAPAPFAPDCACCLLSDQAEHHGKFSYQEELRELLKCDRVTFDERYLWE